VKALSIRQPWAWLIVTGYKDLENRSWRTNYRGPLLIHAGRAIDPTSLHQIERHYGLRIPAKKLLRGGIIGTVELIDVVKEHRSPWFDGKGFAWVLANPHPLDFVEMSGRLGLFDIDFTPSGSVQSTRLAPRRTEILTT
jgi:ASCH domain-containing protein